MVVAIARERPLSTQNLRSGIGRDCGVGERRPSLRPTCAVAQRLVLCPRFAAQPQTPRWVVRSNREPATGALTLGGVAGGNGQLRRARYRVECAQSRTQL